MDNLYHNLAPCGCLDKFEDQEIDFIKDFKYWFLALNWQQGFLGRSMLILKAHKVDELELTAEEVAEKHEIYCQWRKAIDKAFHPDKINQSQQGNEEFLHKGHLHWHFVPRYRRPISFAGAKFQSDDEETQKASYAQVHKKVIYPVEIRKQIRAQLLHYL